MVMMIDSQWQGLKETTAAGITVSAFMVESALAVDPGRPGIIFALTHHDHQVLLMLVESIHDLLYETRGDDPSTRDRVRNSTSFPSRQKIKDMIRDFCGGDLHATPAPMLGEDETTRIVEALSALRVALLDAIQQYLDVRSGGGRSPWCGHQERSLSHPRRSAPLIPGLAGIGCRISGKRERSGLTLSPGCRRPVSMRAGRFTTPERTTGNGFRRGKSDTASRDRCRATGMR